MKQSLLKEAILKYCSGVLLLGLLLFLPAGTIHWPNGLLLMALLFVPMLLAGFVMYYKAPDLLRSRLNAKEKQNTQKDVIRYSGLMFVLAFVIAGLNYRFQWIFFPPFVVTLGCIIFLLSYLLFAEVLRENAYLSRTIEVQENQKVIDTGLYGVVRHPMYFATLFLFLSMPLILNSPISFLMMLLYIPFILMRIKDEEELLDKELNGYKQYKEKVTYKLIPYIW